MKKYLLPILIAALLPVQAIATVYYGGAADKNINGDDLWYTAVTGSCAGDGSPVAWATVNQAGNSIYANGCTIAIPNTANITVDVDLVSNIEQNTPDADAVDGGGFTYVTAATYSLTINSNMSAGGADLLAISGSASGTKVTVNGDLTGGTGSNANVINTTHTVGTVAIVGDIVGGSVSTGTHTVLVGGTGPVTITGNVTGGSLANVAGVIMTGNSTVTITGTLTGGSENQTYALQNGTASGTATVNGDCVGGSGFMAECANSSGASSSVTITGNIIGTATTALPYRGSVIWAPSAATKYIKVISDGTPAAYYMTPNPDPAVTDVKSGVTYGFDGSSVYTGTYSGGDGGGAWGF